MESRPGVICFTDAMTPEELAAFARSLEALDYHALWLPELFGRDPFTTAGFVLGATTRLQVGTGIANVYSRHPIATAQAARTLGELYGGRFLLGLGVSHPPMAERLGMEWIAPVPKMREYLREIAAFWEKTPEQRTPVFIAAHGPGLLRLAARETDGANTYLMPPEHTRRAREILGPEKILQVVLPCCLCPDPEHARRIAARGLAMYLALPAYRRQWETYGFAADDFDDGGSPHLIDTLVAWGDEAQIRSRIDEYLAAGATRVELIAYNPEGGPRPHMALFEALAPHRT